MKDIQTILQDSGVLIQPFWRKLYCHMQPEVKNHAMHPAFELDFGKVWLG
jgi:peptide/nickel transport system substrate-binding protein